MPRISPTFWPWLRARVFPRGTDLIQWAAFVIIISMMVIYVLQTPQVSPLQFNTTLLVLSVLLVINVIWDDLRERFPSQSQGNAVLLAASTALTFFTILYGEMYAAVYLLFMIAAQANLMLRPLPALAFSAFLMAGYLGAVAAAGVTSNPGELVMSLLIGFTFTATLSQVLNRYVEQSQRMQGILSELQEANLALIEAGEKAKELTIAEERLRMARDLHDGLGHHLTALSIQLQAAEKLVRANPDLAAESIHNARGEVQAALKEVRQSVAALRETPVDMMNLPKAVAHLLEETAQRSGLQAQFTQVGETVALSPAAAMTVFRAAQEGLTNVSKHSQGAARVDVELRYSAGAVHLCVENDGDPIPDAAEGSGFGLAGLRERANLLGGSLECGPRPQGGFRLAILLPVQAVQ